MINKVLHRLWHSPTFTTWGSFLIKSLSLILVLPLVLTKFSTEEINVWFLFSIIISLQTVANMGFSPTFTRVIAYAMGGTQINDLIEPKEKANGQPNIATMEEILPTMKTVFFFLSILWFFIVSTIGTLFLLKPIAQLQHSLLGWYAWGFILVGSTFNFYGNVYISFFQGINDIPKLRKLESFSSLISIIFSFIILIFYPNLFFLVFANQFGVVLLNILLNNAKNKNNYGGLFVKKKYLYFNKKIISSIWPSTWRSGVGVLSSFGITQFSGIYYAQIGDSKSVATYLFGLRIIQLINTFSQAPYYSKIPFFNMLYAQKRLEELLLLVQKSMRNAYLSYVVPFIIVGLFASDILNLIGSNVRFPDNMLWSLLGLSFFLERYGAMHIQLYSLTNKIIWHIANGVTGLIIIFVFIILDTDKNINIFPFSMFIGNLLFYCWYPALRTKRHFGLTFNSFDLKTLNIPLLLFLLHFIIILLRAQLHE